jgi:L-cysteine/cystine lyase
MTTASPDLALTQRHRQQFPGLENKVYFNFGGQGPMPQPALDALYQAQLEMQRTGPFTAATNRWIGQQMTELRQAMAVALGAAPDSITLTENVSMGCNIALWGFDWQAGDHLLLTDCEHPSVLGTVQELQRRFGIEVSTCPILETLNQGDPVAVIADHLQPRTRLVALSHLLWNTGQILPLKEIVQACHAQTAPDGQPVRVLADAAQSVGILPLHLDDTGVDFYAYTGHKWWCGPAGLGGLYVSPEAQPHLHPTYIGWRGIVQDEIGQPAEMKGGGAQFEVATSNYALYPALRAAIALHNAWGTDADRYQRISELSAYLWQQLSEISQIHCLSQTPPPAGLVSFQIKCDRAPQVHKQLVQQLEANGFMLRTLLHPNCIRACVHYFTLESEIDQLIDQIKTLLNQMDL